MIQRLVGLALRLRAVIVVLTAALVGLGLLAYRHLDIEAYPNPVPPLVEVIVQPPGWSGEEVERYVTIPLEIALAGMPGLEHMRSQSLFELSDVKCYFGWGTNYQEARQEVINRLQFVQLPNGLQGTLSPWNAIGEVFRYTVEGPGYSPRERKTVQDWVLERQFRQAPGVIDVTSFGGETKQFEVNVDPYRLRGHGLSLSQLTTALQNANQNSGGQRLTLGEQSYNVRGIGLLRDMYDIGGVVITEQQGTPVRVQDVASVEIGHKPRLGIVGKDNEPDVVQGTILMRYGGETLPTLAAIHQRIAFILQNHLLPPGMRLNPFYDRGDLVRVTTHTVLHNLTVGIVLVSLVLYLFLGDLRAALITAITIPLALLVAFCGLVATGTSANLISLGAIDFGIVVDSTVIMMENIFRHLGRHGTGSIRDRILTAAGEVGGPMAFSTAIVAVSFLPLFTMTGVAGVIFAPMARTYAFAIGGAILLALTLTPVLASRFMPADAEERESALMRVLHRVYAPLFDAALRRPRIAVALGLVPIILCVVLFPLLGREFMPKLEEGNLWIRATLPMSIAMETSSQYVGRMRDIVRGCSRDDKTPCTDATRRHPEVLTVVSQLGRPDDGTDVTGFFNIELFAPLKPFDEWPRGLTKERLIAQLTQELQEAFPGVVFNFSQMISDNVEEAVAGVKGENSVKVFGPDLEQNEANGGRIVDVMAHVRGVEDLGLFHSLGQPSVRIIPDRKACARYGLNTGDVTNVVQAAVGGQAITEVYEGEKHFDLTVRWLPPYRESIEAIREITVSAPDGVHIALGQIASFELRDGPATIYREDGERYAPVKFSVRGRDLKSTIDEARAAIAEKVHLPYASHLEWSGEINELANAENRLAIIIPVTLVLIAFLTYSAVRNWVDTVLVLIAVPVACTGGLLALLLTRTNFSVSAAMGFISILGIAIQDAILVVTYFQRLRREGESTVQAAREAAEKRFRPVLMTTLVATLGLLPAAVSHGIGAQTQRPLAIVVIGGSLILAVLTRVLQPPLLVLAHGRLDAPEQPGNEVPRAKGR
jgi:cobalt-zinc-cadmium resistance protein CzcA